MSADKATAQSARMSAKHTPTNTLGRMLEERGWPEDRQDAPDLQSELSRLREINGGLVRALETLANEYDSVRGAAGLTFKSDAYNAARAAITKATGT